MKLFWESHDISISLNYHISKIRMHGLVCPPKTLLFCLNIWKLAYMLNFIHILTWKNHRRPKLSSSKCKLYFEDVYKEAK